MASYSSYDQIHHYVMSLDRKGIFLDLKATQHALQAFGAPQNLYPSILVAGTNGKGSTVAMLSSVLSRSGYRVGSFISPHLLDVRERIQIAQKPISKTDFERIVKKVRKVLKRENIDLTFFEFLVVMAFEYFKEKCVDVAVVEVGLGGRLDATNVLNPIVSVITSVDRDHERFLGKSLASIAREKAGIIKQKGVVVSAVKQPSMRKLLAQVCESKNATLSLVDSEYQIKLGKNGYNFRCNQFTWNQLAVSLKGLYQRGNVGCVLQTLVLLKQRKWDISEQDIREGLKRVKWPGRFHVVSESPMVLLDAAHNMAGVRELVRSIKHVYPQKKVHTVVGLMRDKNHSVMLKTLKKSSNQLYFVEPRVRRALTSNEMREKYPDLSKGIRFYKRVGDALPGIMKNVKKNDLICVTGSLYTVSEAMACLRN